MELLIDREDIKNNLIELEKEFPLELFKKNIKLECIQRDKNLIEFSKNNQVLKVFYTKLNYFYYLIFKADSCEYDKDFIKEFKVELDHLTFQFDASRNNVLKVETVKKLIRYLVILGYDSLAIYMEDTYEIEDEPYFGYMRGRYSINELQEIDEYASKFNLEVVPYIQTLGHLERLFLNIKYWSVLEGDDHLLLRNEKTYELIEKMFKSMRKAFKGKRINIGMDEVKTLGRLNFLDKYGYIDKKKLLLEHLNIVKEIAKKYDFEVSIWSDMFFTSTSLVAYNSLNQDLKDIKVDDSINLVYWKYEYLEVSEYDKIIKLHKKISNNVSVAGGAWKWIGFAPNNSYSLRAIINLFTASKHNNIKEFILTGWGDNGGEASVFSILPSIYYLSNLRFAESNLDDFKKLTGISFKEFKEIDKLNWVTKKFDPNIINCFTRVFLYNDLLLGTYDQFITDYQPKIYKKVAKTLHNLSNNKFEGMFEYLSKLAKVLSLKCEISLNLRKAYLSKDLLKLKEMTKKIKLLFKYLGDFYKTYSYEYQNESKIEGFEIFDLRYGALIQRLRVTENKLLRYLRGEISKIEELELERLDFFGQGQNFIDKKDFVEPRYLPLVSKGVNY